MGVVNFKFSLANNDKSYHLSEGHLHDRTWVQFLVLVVSWDTSGHFLCITSHPPGPMFYSSHWNSYKFYGFWQTLIRENQKLAFLRSVPCASHFLSWGSRILYVGHPLEPSQHPDMWKDILCGRRRNLKWEHTSSWEVTYGLLHLSRCLTGKDWQISGKEVLVEKYVWTDRTWQNRWRFLCNQKVAIMEEILNNQTDKMISLLSS